MQLTFVVDEEHGDWMGLYIDGELVYENHSLSSRDLLDLIDMPYNSVACYMKSAGISRLPTKLEDVPISPTPCQHDNLPEHGFLQAGDYVRCPGCGKEFVRISDEAEGDYWLARDGGSAV